MSGGGPQTAEIKKPAQWAGSRAASWLRGTDSNRRPSGYEPDELPLLHPATTNSKAIGVRIAPPRSVLPEAYSGPRAATTRHSVTRRPPAIDQRLGAVPVALTSPSRRHDRQLRAPRGGRRWPERCHRRDPRTGRRRRSTEKASLGQPSRSARHEGCRRDRCPRPSGSALRGAKNAPARLAIEELERVVTRVAVAVAEPVQTMRRAQGDQAANRLGTAARPTRGWPRYGIVDMASARRDAAAGVADHDDRLPIGRPGQGVAVWPDAVRRRHDRPMPRTPASAQSCRPDGRDVDASRAAREQPAAQRPVVGRHGGEAADDRGRDGRLTDLTYVDCALVTAGPPGDRRISRRGRAPRLRLDRQAGGREPQLRAAGSTCSSTFGDDLAAGLRARSSAHARAASSSENRPASSRLARPVGTRRATPSGAGHVDVGERRRAVRMEQSMSDRRRRAPVREPCRQNSHLMAPRACVVEQDCSAIGALRQRSGRDADGWVAVLYGRVANQRLARPGTRPGPARSRIGQLEPEESARRTTAPPRATDAGSRPSGSHGPRPRAADMRGAPGVALEGRHHRVSLCLGHDEVFDPLEEDHRAEPTGPRNASASARDRRRPARGRGDEAVEVPRLELVRVPGQGLEIADAVLAGAGAKTSRNASAVQRRVAAGAAAADRNPLSGRLGLALPRYRAALTPSSTSTCPIAVEPAISRP